MVIAAAGPRAARPLQPPRSGLLASPATRVVEQDAGVNWGAGLEWQTELHLPTSNAVGARAVKCGPATVNHTATDKAPLEQGYPFSVYAFDWCTAIGYDQRDFEGRARRLLEATQSFSIAKELWNGTIAAAEAIDNVWLAKNTAATVNAAAERPRIALAKLDQRIAVNLRNGQGVIHADVEVFDRLRSDSSIDRDGDRWLTPFGNIVVADGGYDGHRDGATASTRWMVATTILEVTLGPVRTTGVRAPAEWVQAFDYTKNDIVVWAERDVIVLHDAVLLHAAAQVDLAP